MPVLALQTMLVASGLLSVTAPTSVRETQVRHEIRLQTNAASSGMLIEARIHQQRVLLLLDTGARDIVLSAKAAARCGLASEQQTMLSGLNGGEAQAGKTAATIDLAGLQLARVPVQILPESPVRQADGLIGTQVFRAFLVEIDAKRERLRLLSRGSGSGAVPLTQVGHMLFVRIDSGGYALVDTGSSCSVVDQALVYPTGDGQWTQVRGAAGKATQALAVAGPARFSLGNGAVLWDRHPVAIDLKALSQKHGLDVTAVIGYPALSGRVMQLDYLNRTLRLIN